MRGSLRRRRWRDVGQPLHGPPTPDQLGLVNWTPTRSVSCSRSVKARERLTVEGRWEECRRGITALADRHNQATDVSLLMYAEYLIVVGRKAFRPGCLTLGSIIAHKVKHPRRDPPSFVAAVNAARAPAAYSKYRDGSPPVPSSPGPTCVPISGPTSDTKAG
jgi:hypothetical protein